MALDPTLCVKLISEPPWYIYRYQCQRKRGHGPNGDYCKQHALIVERRAEYRREAEKRANES
jgi:hypothetical protein